MNFSRKKSFLIKIWFVISFYNIQKIKKYAFYICKEYICQPYTANNVENSKGSENQKQKCSFAGIWGKNIPFHHFSSALSWFVVKDFQYFFWEWLSHCLNFLKVDVQEIIINILILVLFPTFCVLCHVLWRVSKTVLLKHQMFGRPHKQLPCPGLLHL